MKIKKIIFLLLFFATKSFALDDTQLLEYIKYITEVSTLKYNGEPLPKISLVKPNILELYAYTAQEITKAESENKKLPKILGIYYPGKKQLLISNDLDINSIEVTPTVVHELVHYLQDINGITASFGDKTVCLEGEAYDIQQLWQIENKVLLDQMPSYEIIVLAHMKCGAQF